MWQVGTHGRVTMNAVMWGWGVTWTHVEGDMKRGTA
jgi:hypothetical protein